MEEPRRMKKLPKLHRAILSEQEYEALAASLNNTLKSVNRQADIALQSVDISKGTHSHMVHRHHETLHEASPLHLAVLQGDIRLIQLLMSKGVDPSLTCSYESSASSGYEGSSSHSFNISGVNALHLAIFLCDHAAATAVLRCAAQPKALIEAQIASYQTNSSRFSPDTGSSSQISVKGANALHLNLICSEEPKPRPTRSQKSHGATTDQGTKDLFEYMLEFNPFPDGQLISYETSRTDDGCFHSNRQTSTYRLLTPLHLACMAYKVPCIVALLKAGVGANPNSLFKVKRIHTSEYENTRHIRDDPKEKPPPQRKIGREIPILHYMFIRNRGVTDQLKQPLLEAGADPHIKVDTLLVSELATRDSWDGTGPEFKPPKSSAKVDYDEIVACFSGQDSSHKPSAKERGRKKEKKTKNVEKEKEKEVVVEEEKLTFKVGNTAQQVGGGDEPTWKWCCFVRGEGKAEGQIESVTFRLHPTFRPNVIKVDQSPFQLERTGWGTFMVTIQIALKKRLRMQQVHQVQHQLDFSKTETSSVYQF